MRLLKTPDTPEDLDAEFDEVTEVDLETLSPEVIDGEADVRVEEDINEVEACFLNIPEKNPKFGRALLEIIEEKGIETQHSPLGYYITAKKNYLHYVLNQKEVPTPRTTVAASEKSAKNIDRHIDIPIVAKRYKENQLSELKLLEDPEDIEEFAEGTEYGEEILIFQEKIKGDKYKVMYAAGNIISLEDSTEGWMIDENRLQYSNLSNKYREVVKEAMEAIGTDYGELVIRDGLVTEINPNPDLAMYAQKSGKNPYSCVREIY